MNEVSSSRRHMPNGIRLARFLLFIPLCVLLLLLNPVRCVALGDAGLSQAAAAQITQEHVYDSRFGSDPIAEDIIGEDGSAYHLSELSLPFPLLEQTATRWFKATVSYPLTSEQQEQGDAAVRLLFDEALSLEMDGHFGTLHMEGLSVEPVYRSIERQVDREVVYPDLPSEDVLQLPLEADFSISSDRALGETTVSSFKRLAVSWDVTGYADDGRPETYQARVIFRGSERLLDIDYYIATASYEGLLAIPGFRVSILATYDGEKKPEPKPEPVEIQPTIKIAPIQIPAEPPASEKPVDWLPLIIATGFLIVMLLALLFFGLFLYRNARLIEVQPDGAIKILMRKHIRLKAGEGVFRINPLLSICKDQSVHRIILSRGLAAKRGQLTVLWGDRFVFQSQLKKVIDITEELVQLVSDSMEMANEYSIKSDHSSFAETEKAAGERIVVPQRKGLAHGN